MKSVPTAAAGVLLCLGLAACETFGTRTEPTESPKKAPSNPPITTPPAPLPSGTGARIEPFVASGSREKVFRGEEALREIRERQPSGGTNSLSWGDGKMTVRTDYPDGSSMSIISGGPNGNEIEFRPAPPAPRRTGAPDAQSN